MINHSFFIGRVSTELELRKTKTDVSCCNFQLAVQRKNTDITDFPPMTAYGKMAENICSYVQKGDLVGVSASYQSSIKNHKKYHEFKVEEIQFLDNKKAGDYEGIEIPSSADYNSGFGSNGDDDLLSIPENYIYQFRNIITGQRFDVYLPPTDDGDYYVSKAVFSYVDNNLNRHNVKLASEAISKYWLEQE